MLLADAVAVAEARTHLAALADQAASVDASLAYEQILLHLDAIHRDDVPAINDVDLVDDLPVLHAVAASAVRGLIDHGLDALQVELVFAMLEEAHELDAPA